MGLFKDYQYYVNIVALPCHFQVIWKWWKISPRSVDRTSKPGQLKESHQEFLDDPELQGNGFFFRPVSVHHSTK